MSVSNSPEQLEVLSDLFTNLSAGWFGTILIFPGIFRSDDPITMLRILLVNIAFGILSLQIAFRLKEQSHE